MLAKLAWPVLLAAAAAASAVGAELNFDWQPSLDRTPPGFASLVTGPGAPGVWKVIEDEVPPMLAPLSPQAHPVTAQAVLAVKSMDIEPNRFAVLLYTNDTFDDFTLTTRMKIVEGITERSAGLVFRAQDASNYYVLRAGTDGYLLWHRVVDGKSIEALGVGVRTPIPRQKWIEIKVECKGSAIRCFLDGKLLIPPAKAGAPTDNLAVNDSTFGSGKIGFWAKADTVAYFVNTRLQFVPRVPYMQTVASEIMRKYPRILGLDIYAARHTPKPVIIASKDTNNLGQAGGHVEEDVIKRGIAYFAKDKPWVEVWLPLRDRNGDIVAALKTRLERFPGETQDTAVARATQVKKAVEAQLDTMQDIME